MIPFNQRISARIEELFDDWFHKPVDDIYSETTTKIIIRELILIRNNVDIRKYCTKPMEDLHQIVKNLLREPIAGSQYEEKL